MMEALIKIQINARMTIEKAYINFKKSPKDRLSKESYLLARSATLEEQWKLFVDTHRSISGEVTEKIIENSYFTEDVYGDTAEIYINYKSDLQEALSLVCSPSRSSTPSETHGNNVKLPKIAIPIFSGSYSEWPTFKDLYTSLIHNNSSLENVQKMHYLKGHLSGEAEQLLRHVSITAANYQESWSILNNRYNNKRYLANCLLKRFMNQPAANTESCNAIKQLLDVTMDTLNGLKNLGISVNSWDTIVIYIVASKFDPESRKQWEQKLSTSDELPTFDQLKEFMEYRFRALEFLDENQKLKPNISNKPKTLNVVANNSVEDRCKFCDQSGHKIYACKSFNNCNFQTRHDFVQTNGLCFNCLGPNHSANICRVTARCRICRGKHHSLLHPKSNLEKTATTTLTNANLAVEDSTAMPEEASPLDEDSTENVVTHFSNSTADSIHNQVLLATAHVKVQASSGYTHVLRALLDQGSQASFVTESSVQLLGLKKIPTRSVISGLGGDKRVLSSRHIVEIAIQSRHDSNFKVQVRAHVLGTITGLLPSEKVSLCNFSQLAGVSLADPEYHQPNKIDILLGADVYGQIIKEGLIKGGKDSPTAQNTALGWILSGPTPSDRDQNKSHCHHNVVMTFHSQVDDNEMLKRFWETESTIVETKLLTEEEKRCEEHYKQTTQRDSVGRYVVRLPFRDDDPQCKYGNSRDIALKRFHYLENRFKRNPEIKPRYAEVIHEYLELGHMERVQSNDDPKQSEAVYLPHHAVIREDRSTTKVRVVFDASCKGTNGVSLNDTLMIGPSLQLDLRHIIMRWRMHPICLCADIVKMYRQVIVANQDADFQRLVWRDEPNSEIEEYRLLRVTFGTAAAPYLAIKTLQQVALDEGLDYPEVAEKVKTDFYVDDLMTGCQTIEEGRRIHKQMKEMLAKGGFDLQKWITNSKELAEEIMDRKGEHENIDIKLDEVVKILGLSWHRESDYFQYSTRISQVQPPVTKRKVISDIAKLFDPLGWAAPCVITAKVMIQKLWLSGIDWDDELPKDLLDEWLKYKDNLLEIGGFQIPRWIRTSSDDKCLELHGFCDASNMAYAAVVYIRTINKDGIINANLVTAKTKVAPTMQVSIPRLELMGAVLLAKLITEVAKVLYINNAQIHGWTDSTVVLAWLSSHPSRWTTFIGNRTSEILSRMDNTQWAHVQSAENPADIASRGLLPSEIIQNRLWMHGPNWLQNQNIEYSRPKSISTTLEQRSIKSHVISKKPIEEDSFWRKYSSLRKLLRVIAFCRRFLSKKKPSEPYLTSKELNDALDVCIRQCQIHLQFEKIQSLCPTLDAKGIWRVGGRLKNSDLPEDVKHPILLPHSSHFTNLVIDEAHQKTLHGGPTLMLNHIRTKYWIVSAKNLVKMHVRRCVVCIRHTASTRQPMMGQLPSSRVKPARPFLLSGVDFAGPINLRVSKGRGNRSYKGYICLFVCMITKALHIEVVSDLTSKAFIASFKRFVARRGHVSDIWSDNGTNFVGASKEISRLVAAETSSVAIEIREWLGNNNVAWHFIPPHAPNFGGLWEAGVKSTKYHLKRVIGESTLTYEEMATVLAQVEACLNSRPLSLLPSDCNDPMPLTPGHFLIGEPVVICPDHNYENSNVSSLKRWQMTQRMVQDFWRRWSNEYLVHCVQRYKWSKQISEPKIGDVVLIKEDNLPPARWLLGKIIDKHPGLDNVTRVVTLKCKGSVIKRPISKLCVLPVTD